MQIVESVLPATDSLEVDMDVSMRGSVLVVKKSSFVADGRRLSLDDDYEADCSAEGDHIVYLAQDTKTESVEVLADHVKPGHMPIGGIVIGDFRRHFVLAQVSVRGSEVTLIINRRKKQEKQEE